MFKITLTDRRGPPTQPANPAFPEGMELNLAAERARAGNELPGHSALSGSRAREMANRVHDMQSRFHGERGRPG
jgi:hypothetical protein